MDTADDAELESTYKTLNAEIIVYCHVHRLFVRQVGRVTVCNCGSVGMPYDGDPRSSYLLIDGGNPVIRRVEYDVEKEVSRCWRQIIRLKIGMPKCAGVAATFRLQICNLQQGLRSYATHFPFSNVIAVTLLPYGIVSTHLRSLSDSRFCLRLEE